MRDAKRKALHLLAHPFQKWPIAPLNKGSGNQGGTWSCCSVRAERNKLR